MSNELEKDKEIVALEKKLIEKMGQSAFVLEVRRSSKAELDAKLGQVSEGIQEIITAKSEDEALKEAKERARELAAPYNESKKIAEAKARFIHLVTKDEFGA